MEATRTTVSERPLTVWVPPGVSSRLCQCPWHRVEPSLSPGAERTQVYAVRRLFCQAPRRRFSLSRVLHVLLLQVNGGKMRWRKCLECATSPFCSCFTFFSFYKWHFCIKTERAHFHSSHWDFGLQRSSVMGDCWVLIITGCSSTSSSWVGLGSLLPNKGRSPGDSEWNFFLIGNTHNT